MSEQVEQVARCKCPTPYLGTQPAGTPVRCERCGGLVEQAAVPEDLKEDYQYLLREVSNEGRGAASYGSFGKRWIKTLIERIAAAEAKAARLEAELKQAREWR